MKSELTKRLINAMIGNYECSFSNCEKEYIANLTIGTMSDFEEKKFFYLLVNTKNNLSNEWKKNINKVLSYLSFDLEGSSFFEKTNHHNQFQYTFHQEMVYRKFDHHNLILIAGTGFGKTTLFSNYFIENYKRDGGRYVICVPTELLEQQLITNLQAKYKELKAKIGNNIFKNDLLVLTPEKLFLASKLRIQINKMLVDEAHNLLSKDIDRMVFAQKEILKHINKVDNVYFTTPFMNMANILTFKEIFKDLNLKHISIEKITNKKNIVIQELDQSFISPKKTEYNPVNINDYDMPILIYENSKRKCLELAKLELEKNGRIDYSYDPRINKAFSKWDFVKFKSIYLPLKLARYRIGYIHGDMPIGVKNTIIQLVKDGYIKKIFATHAILNGIDLPFQHLIVNQTKIFKRTMSIADFNNLRGRVSRWDNTKRGNGLGLTIIKKSEFNQDWFSANKDQLNHDTGVASIVEDDMSLFVNKSYGYYASENQKIYLIDPRINPETTQKIDSNNFHMLGNWEELVFYRKKSDKKDLEKFIKNLFTIYDLGSYDQRYQNLTSKKAGHNSTINAVRNYCWGGFSVDNAIQKYIHSPLMKKIENDELKWTETFERSLMQIKRYGKYFFMMFLGHYISMKKLKSFVEYLAYGTFDDKLIEAIENTKNTKRWIKMVNEYQKENDQNGKRFDTKWKDCQKLIKGKKLKREYTFIAKIVEHIETMQKDA